MADAPNTATTLTANYKEVYADDLKDLRPAKYLLRKNFRFKSSARLGNVYHQPVLLAREGGFTYAAAKSSVTYEDAIPSTVKDAQLDGSQIFGHAFIDFEAAARGESSKHAFKQSVGIVIESLWDASLHRGESDLWYGQQDLGVVKTGSTTTGIIITDATWAAALFTACEGSKIEVWASDLGTDRGSALISAVDVENKKLTVGAGLTAVTAGDRITWEGQYSGSAWRSMLGLVPMLNTSSGNVLNISTSYSKWKPIQKAVGGNLTLAAIQDGISLAVQKGLDQDVTLLMSTKTWGTVCTDWASLVRFNSQTGTYSLGAEALKVVSSGVKVNIISTPFCKEGYAVQVPMREFFRVGASDLTDDIPGRKGMELFTLVHGTNLYEFQTYQHQALFGLPGQCVLYTGITNT